MFVNADQIRWYKVQWRQVDTRARGWQTGKAVDRTRFQYNAGPLLTDSEYRFRVVAIARDQTQLETRPSNRFK